MSYGCRGIFRTFSRRQQGLRPKVAPIASGRIRKEVLLDLKRVSDLKSVPVLVQLLSERIGWSDLAAVE